MVDQKVDLSDEAKARISFVHSVVPRRKPRYLRKVLGILVVIVIIMGLVWLLGSGNQNKINPKLNKPVVASAVKLSPSTPTTSYTSNFFGMSLSYPKDWMLKDTGKGLLSLTSPLTNLVAANGTNVKGQVSLSINKQGALPSGLSAGTDLAVLNSAVLSYANPSADQSGQTYVSFVQYSSTNTVGGLDGVYVTGNNGYQKDGVVPTSDIANMNPLIYISFASCSNKDCSKFSPLTIASTSWTSTALGQVVSSMIESFVFS